MITIQIPTPLRRFTGDHGEVAVEAATVGEALQRLVETHASLRPHLYANDGKLRTFVNVFKNDEDVRYLDKEATAVATGDRLTIIPSIDLEAGRSRVVFWPGAAAGIGAPTDRPERIVEQLVGQGAKLIHLIDFDGARSGAPGNLDAVGAIASRSAVPLQLAGGVDSPEAIQLAFAAGATRVVLTTTIADRPADLRACLAIAGDWLAVGLDPRPERLAAFPWRRPAAPTVDELVGELVGTGVGRFVLAHGGTEPDLERVPGARPDHPGAEHGGDPTAALQRRVPGVGEPRIEPDGARGRAGRDGGVDHPPQAAPCASSTSSGMSKFA